MASKKYFTEEEKKEARRLAVRRYRKSKKYKESQKKYNKSDARKETLKKYNTSNKRKIVNKKYRETEKGKTTNKKASIRYRASEKGRLNKTSYQKSDKYKEWKNRWKRHRYANDETYKITVKLRNRVNEILRRYDNKKRNRTIKLLGCDIKFFISYIESQFLEGMSWDNQGSYTWHIDHIKPCASFDLSRLSEQEKCFNYKNLRPIWAKDNLSKGSKIISQD